MNKVTFEEDSKTRNSAKGIGSPEVTWIAIWQGPFISRVYQFKGNLHNLYGALTSLNEPQRALTSLNEP